MTNVLQKNWQDLIKPSKLEITPGRDRTRTATIVAEPLERGFGMTLGNALRRVLLSSLQGAAIKTVQIDGVLHEFSSIPGVREDVTNIVLNIKEIALRIHSDGVKRMVLKKEGPGVLGTEAIKWNFTKFLVDKDGKVLKRFAPKTEPEEIAADIERALGA